MIPDISNSIAWLLVAAEVAIATAIWNVVSIGAARSGLAKPAQRRVRLVAGTFLGAWLAGTLLLAPDPESLAAVDPLRVTPSIPVLGLVTVVAGLLGAWRWNPLRRALASVPLAALHALQSWRVVGLLFVILYARGSLPAHFALPAGWGDLFIGITAPLLAIALARRWHRAVGVAVAWNVLGMLDLVMAVGLGTGLLAPLLFPELGPRVPPAAAMGVFPLVLVPLFAVPASMIVHTLALARLVREIRPRPLRVGRGQPVTQRGSL